MELPELTLAPTQFVKTNISSPKSESNSSRKRKLLHDHHHLIKSESSASIQTSVDLQVKDPLPMDWEQCLDLESGKMYYLNRKTLRKSWNWPKEQKLDLELNISTLSYNYSADQHYNTFEDSKKNNKHQQSSSGSNNNNMVALACLNCHLLVILSKSSPACPNCKYVHSLPNHQNPSPKISSAVKSINTLSLLN